LLITKLATSLGCWLGPANGKPLNLRLNLDGLDALSADRDAHAC
jgi:phage portal protein BeeE